MNKLLVALISVFFAFSIAVATQTPNSKTGTSDNPNLTRKTIFRATSEQIKQAQGIVKQRGFYGGAQTGALDPATRVGLKQYQKAEGLRVTGTLNKLTLEKMGIALTDKQKSM